MSQDLAIYLKELENDDDPRWRALKEVLKAFDTGVFPMFSYSEEDLAYSREHGALPEAAQPTGCVLQFALLSSRTGGGFMPPWYVAEQLRKAADNLMKQTVDQFERWQESSRMAGEGGMARLERTLGDTKRRLSMIQDIAEGLTLNQTEETLNRMIQQLLDLGVNLPRCETEGDLHRLRERLPELVHDEIEHIKGRIERISENEVEDHVVNPETPDLPTGHTAEREVPMGPTYMPRDADGKLIHPLPTGLTDTTASEDPEGFAGDVDEQPLIQ